MEVFIDESGDLGFGPKSSNFFVVAYMLPRETVGVRSNLSKLLRKMHRNRKYSGSELKFSNSNDDTRLFVLGQMMKYEWTTGIIVLEKGKVKQTLRDKINILYNYCIIHNIFHNLLLSLDEDENINIHIDKSLSMNNRDSFNTYARGKASYIWEVELARHHPLKTDKISLLHEDSFNDPCIQLADFVAGAAFQRYERKNEKYYQVIEDRITSFNYLW